ncbi:MAG TPA: hypothetical protein VE287_05995, partial [Actinopolymorphaceae bacterium]|nr:hypothetical protein [Actinopolymorphaceae bacterium]
VVTYDAFGGYGHPDHIRAHRITLAAVEAAAFTGLYPEAGPAWRVGTLRLVTLSLSVVMEAVRRGVWRRGLGTPDEEIDAFVDVRPWLDTKVKALQQHASEIARGATIKLVLDPAARDGFLGTECYLWRAGPGASRSQREEDDLFRDLRRS